jgi:hypothetical protein
MTVWKIYRYEDMVLVPTMVVTDEGVFIETGPVQSVSIEEVQELLDLIERLLASPVGKAQEKDLNNPDSPLASSRPVLLEMLKIKRWRDFEKRALMYTLFCQGAQLTMHVTGRAPDGMWLRDDSKNRNFSLEGSATEACRGIVAELISRRPVDSPRTLALAPLPPPPGNTT